jgi:hypothetical protein
VGQYLGPTFIEARYEGYHCSSIIESDLCSISEYLVTANKSEHEGQGRRSDILSKHAESLTATAQEAAGGSQQKEQPTTATSNGQGGAKEVRFSLAVSSSPTDGLIERRALARGHKAFKWLPPADIVYPAIVAQCTGL